MPGPPLLLAKKTNKKGGPAQNLTFRGGPIIILLTVRTLVPSHLTWAHDLKDDVCHLFAIGPSVGIRRLQKSSHYQVFLTITKIKKMR